MKAVIFFNSEATYMGRVSDMIGELKRRQGHVDGSCEHCLSTTVKTNLVVRKCVLCHIECGLPSCFDTVMGISGKAQAVMTLARV